ncbi:hypothetical protein Dimus_033549 [Dionaea muscipula]
MREGLGSEEADLRPAMTELTVVVSPNVGLAPSENFDPDLNSSSAGLSLTMAATLPDVPPLYFEARGCKEALGITTVSAALSDGVDSETMEADLPVIILDEPVTDGVPGKRGADGEEIQDCVVGLDVLPSSCFPVSAHSPLRFAESENRGCGVLKIAVGVDPVLSSPCPLFLGSTAMCCPDSEVAGVGDSEGMAISSPMSSLALVCAGEQDAGIVGGGVAQPASVEFGVGGEGGVGSVAVVQPTEPVCSILPIDFVSSSLTCVHSLLASDVDPHADGIVREEVRVLPSARGALRPQPTDGLWQPLSSPMEPVSESVGKDKGIHGDSYYGD